MIYSLGCDISKDKHVACLLRYRLASQEWEVISRKSFANSIGGCKALGNWLGRLMAKQPLPLRATMEATGIYYEQLALYLHEHPQKIHLSVVLPSKASCYIASRGLRNKTDKIDAFGLALMGAERKLPSWGGIDSYWRTLRELTRTRAGLLKQITVIRNQLHAQYHSGTQVKSVEQSLERVLKALQAECEHLMQQIRQHLAGRTELKQQMDCLQSIPGVGLKTIAVILAETLGFEHFTSISQLMSFSGYDVKADESGKRVGKRKISKQGSPYIRQAMYMPASTIVRCKPIQIYRLYQRLLKRHGIKMKAHVALQKKLLAYMYTLWKKKQRYDPAVIKNQRKEWAQQQLDNQPQTQKNVAPSTDEATVDTCYALA